MMSGDDKGKQGAANLMRSIHPALVNHDCQPDSVEREVAELFGVSPEHRHDLGITISVGDLQATQIVALRTILEREVQALVERVNSDTAALTGQRVGWFVSYDGYRECGEH